MLFAFTGAQLIHVRWHKSTHALSNTAASSIKLPLFYLYLSYISDHRLRVIIYGPFMYYYMQTELSIMSMILRALTKPAACCFDTHLSNDKWLYHHRRILPYPELTPSFSPARKLSVETNNT